ncbi:activating transcription factor of chaperone isoform X3 [Drosophila innubila]|uniref:activating transcription factor of chaperone isoform X3 n=1 Tax=Drosophila innubila TaxID=198719 RepID=UPI00148B3E06|nr:activating transcription factor of chaperone isoform X3 [Drosophila innubila]
MSSYIFMQQAYECLLDQKAPHYIEYETAGFPQHLDVLSQAILPITKAQVAATVADFQHCDSSFTLQQLTPPQSPPQFDAYQQQQHELVKEEQRVQQHNATEATSPAAATPAYSFTNNWMPVSQIDRESKLVDDIVNMRAQELQLPTNWQQYNDDCESQASSSLGSSSNSDSSITGSSVADVDEEWLPETSSSSPAHTIEEAQSTAASPSSTKKRTRTYGRGVEDRKIRKKEQNKNAATRYRQKKKIEMEHVLGEEQQLIEANDELRRTLAERRNESRYLRQLIREFYHGRKK